MVVQWCTHGGSPMTDVPPADDSGFAAPGDAGNLPSGGSLPAWRSTEPSPTPPP